MQAMSLFLPEVFLLSLVFEANIREMSLDPWSYKRSLEKREQRRCVCVGGLGGGVGMHKDEGKECI